MKFEDFISKLIEIAINDERVISAEYKFDEDRKMVYFSISGKNSSLSYSQERTAVEHYLWIDITVDYFKSLLEKL